MPLSVIGAGFGRTGTLSMKLALEQLGFGPCHHMMEVFGKPDHIALWQAAADGRNVDWESVFEGYTTAVDWPVCYFWRELASLYPDAKILLTKRDPDKWYDSCMATIFRGMIEQRETDDPHGKMARSIVANNTFGGDLADRANAIRVFNQHIEDVIDTIPAERLLVFEAVDGWQPLCNFLDVPVPQTDYPRVNSSEEFQARFIATNQAAE